MGTIISVRPRDPTREIAVKNKTQQQKIKQKQKPTLIYTAMRVNNLKETIELGLITLCLNVYVCTRI